MAYRHGNRSQMTLLPQSIEEYIPHDDPVRAYDAFVEALDFSELGIEINPTKVGNSEYDPKAMLKLFVYGYSYGPKSSRKLERATYHNLSFIWLMGGLKPDHKTIAEFRRKNKKAIQNVLKQCARMCIKLDLIAGNVLFVDGTKIRANASTSRTHEKAWYEEKLKEIDQRIEQLLQDCEAVDQQEEHLSSFVEMDKELTKTQTLKNTIEDILKEFKETERNKINQTDPDCANMSSHQGKHASYNVQSVVDEKNGLITHAEAVSDANDLSQFARQIDQAQDVMEKPCKTACADNGYADTDELEKIDAQNIKVIVPSRRQALHGDPEPFSKQEFNYDKEHDCYYCPEGHKLKLSSVYKKTGNKYYQITDKQLCFSCQHWGLCTKGKTGRRLVRLHNEEIKEKLEAQYEQTESQEIYSKRKERVELPFGHIKRNLKTDSFLLRGRDGVQAETSLLATCFNIARMITILGVSGILQKLPATI
jgi:transposase